MRQEADVVCSQPGALLSSAEIDTVVFDKTGTLTADTQSLSNIVTYADKGIATPKEQKDSVSKNVNTNHIDEQSHLARIVLAGSHSLVYLEKEVGPSCGPAAP